MKIRESCLQSGTFIYKPGISVTKQDFHLQMGSLGLQMGFSGYYLPICTWRGNMVEVRFYDTVNDELLKFAVIISQSNGKWVFCKHKERDTYEVPGGHREDGEDILETAKRELYEETGAITFDITPICIYSVTAPDNFDGMETFGKLFFSDIHTFEKELHSEIEKIAIMDELPINWTYPEIQPKLLEEARKRGF